MERSGSTAPCEATQSQEGSPDGEAVRAFFNAADAFARHNGMQIVGVGPGHAVAEMILAPHHLNGAQTVHGGALFTLADFAFAAAVNAGGQLALSINASITYHCGAASGRLRATAREVSATPKLASYEVAIRDEAGELLASFHGTAYRKSLSLASLMAGPPGTAAPVSNATNGNIGEQS